MGLSNGLDSTGLNSLAPDSFKMIAETRRQLGMVSEKAKAAILQCCQNSEEMKAFIESQGTPVYLLKKGLLGNMGHLLTLKLLGFEPGFIPASPGKRYQRLIQWLTREENHNPIYFDNTRFEHGVFVLTSDVFNVSFLTHQIHHWMACLSGLGGYSEDSMALYKTFWNQHEGQISGKMLQTMSLEEAMQLKDAINRDLEALCFLQKMVDEVFIPQQKARQLKA